MTPVWMVRSGKFAGWYSNDALYDDLGRYVGFMAGTTAYSTAGEYLGEIYQAEWIGRRLGVHRAHPGPHPRGDNVAHARLADRQGLDLADWQDPDYCGILTERKIGMSKLTVEGVGEFEVPSGKRLVLALEDEAGIDQLHACGGNARCTTCRVKFVAGEPEKMTAAEKNVLAARGLSGVRLSCQIVCDHDMAVEAISRLAGSGRKDAGNRPTDDIQPQPVEWVEK